MFDYNHRYASTQYTHVSTGKQILKTNSTLFEETSPFGSVLRCPHTRFSLLLFTFTAPIFIVDVLEMRLESRFVFADKYVVEELNVVLEFVVVTSVVVFFVAVG